MSTATRPPRADEPDLDAEREVDIGRYLDALVARWWLPLVGLIVGVAFGYLLALGGKQVYRAHATVYVGTPYGPSGNVALQTLATNPNTVSRVVHGEETIKRVAAASGMPPRELRSGISIQVVKSSGVAKTAPNQLYIVSVKGSRRAEVSAATTGIAQRVVDVVGGYANVKIKSFRAQLASDERQLTTLDREVTALSGEIGRGLSAGERLALLAVSEQRRGTLEQDRLQTLQLLAVSEQVELPQIIDRGAATKTTARSTRNSAAIAALIGLVLGILAALFWEPVATRMGRT
ncbi:MAG: hypothetical protein E6G45_05200 [Actinobacteria bacterium]|nr:MAG: hypothetical protein E6G45_05200 [Actinomycetota bacterium]